MLWVLRQVFDSFYPIGKTMIVFRIAMRFFLSRPIPLAVIRFRLKTKLNTDFAKFESVVLFVEKVKKSCGLNFCLYEELFHRAQLTNPAALAQLICEEAICVAMLPRIVDVVIVVQPISNTLSSCVVADGVIAGFELKSDKVVCSVPFTRTDLN